MNVMNNIIVLNSETLNPNKLSIVNKNRLSLIYNGYNTLLLQTRNIVLKQVETFYNYRINITLNKLLLKKFREFESNVYNSINGYIDINGPKKYSSFLLCDNSMNVNIYLQGISCVCYDYQNNKIPLNKMMASFSQLSVCDFLLSPNVIVTRTQFFIDWYAVKVKTFSIE
jgi:hypothetical protein